MASETALDYPFPGPPEMGRSIEVAPGVRWVRMPLPFRLNHINLWLLDDGDGWALVDTGLRSDDTVAAWNVLFRDVMQGRPLRRIFATHMHPDHVGMAGWLVRRDGAQFAMTRLEYLMCRVIAADTGREPPAEAISFYREAGWSRQAIESYRVRFGRFGEQVHTLPESHLRLVDGMELRIGGRTWRVVTGNGHSPEHACFHCADERLFISGDQVLPRISSNVSVHPMEPDADPMADWLASLDKIARQVPDDVLVLPAHNDCFRGLHTRLAVLKESQLRALDALRARLAEPRRAVDVFEALFGRPIVETQPALLGMATGESLACLNYLLHRGEARRELRDGVAWYAMAGG